MKKSFLILFISGMFVSGCASEPKIPRTDCRTFSEYSTIVLKPFNAGRAIVENADVGNGTSTLNGISDSIGEKLKSRLDDYKKFDKIQIAGSCADHTLIIEGNITGLSHRKGKFHVFVNGNVSDCKTGESLYKFELEETDSKLMSIPNQIAGKISKRTMDRLFCI
ncbi:MAG: hypothetical protein AAB174_04625 [Pseudomonadota bacterium]